MVCLLQCENRITVKDKGMRTQDDIENETDEADPVFDVRKLIDNQNKMVIERNDMSMVESKVSVNETRKANGIKEDEIKGVPDDMKNEIVTVDEVSEKHCITKQKLMGNLTKVPVLECKQR